MSKKPEVIKCCLCGENIKPVGTWTQGNNARPLKDGRCCDDCNMNKVIPARLGMMKR